MKATIFCVVCAAATVVMALVLLSAPTPPQCPCPASQCLPRMLGDVTVTPPHYAPAPDFQGPATIAEDPWKAAHDACLNFCRHGGSHWTSTDLVLVCECPDCWGDSAWGFCN